MKGKSASCLLCLTKFVIIANSLAATQIPIFFQNRLVVGTFDTNSVNILRLERSASKACSTSMCWFAQSVEAKLKWLPVSTIERLSTRSFSNYRPRARCRRQSNFWRRCEPHPHRTDLGSARFSQRATQHSNRRTGCTVACWPNIVARQERQWKRADFSGLPALRGQRKLFKIVSGNYVNLKFRE
jgi:hypothetical protein